LRSSRSRRGNHDFGHAVDLVQQQEIRGRHLLRERVVEVARHGELLRVHDHHRNVVADPAPHRVAPELELGLERQCDSRGLDHDPVGLRALAQRLERLDERVGELAAYAAAGELDVVLIRFSEQRCVDAELAELVRDHRDACAGLARVGEQVAHERGLAAAEIARDHQDRNPAGLRLPAARRARLAHAASSNGGSSGSGAARSSA
jgi:hypothetical protein